MFAGPLWLGYGRKLHGVTPRGNVEYQPSGQPETPNQQLSPTAIAFLLIPAGLLSLVGFCLLLWPYFAE
jgi:hypothetical protein